MIIHPHMPGVLNQTGNLFGILGFCALAHRR
jgi:hypothetical protein